jgi:hypothetical protein
MIKTTTNLLQIVKITNLTVAQFGTRKTPLPSLPPSPHTNQFLYVEILTTSLILLF